MKKIITIILCILLALSLTACGSVNKEAITGDTLMDSAHGGLNFGSADSIVSDESFDTNKSPTMNESSPSPSQNTTDEKIIKTVDLTVETKEFDNYLTLLKSNVSKFGGYVENSESNYGRYEYSTRRAYYIVRIPANKLEDFLASASEKGTIISKNEQQSNVTLEYVDIQSRINAYKTERETLTNLLSMATSLADTLSIQERLSEVNYQIETYTSKLNILENRVSYSTVSVDITEVERITETEPTLWSRIKERFSDNLIGIKEWFEDVIVGLIGGIPVMVPILIVVIPIAVLIFKKHKAKKTKSEKHINTDNK